MTPIESTKLQIAELEQAILSAHPRLPHLLKDIWVALKNDPANVTLLAEEEVAVLVQGLEKQTATTLASVALASKGKKSMKSTSVDDL